MIRAPVNPALLVWARKRAGRALEDLVGRFPRLAEWESGAAQPSPNLLDTIYACQQRQSWYRDHSRVNGLMELDFVGNVSLQSGTETVAADIRERLGFSLAARRQCSI